MKKRSKKLPTASTKTETPKQAEVAAPAPEALTEEPPAGAALAEEQTSAEEPEEKGDVEEPVEAGSALPEPETPPEEEPEAEEQKEEPVEEAAPAELKSTDDVCGPLGKLCTCARSMDSQPRVPTAILVERHGERLRRHEEKLEDLYEANRIILDKMLSLKGQISVSYGLSLVLAIVVCVMTLSK
jgi:hypothetical protein